MSAMPSNGHPLSWLPFRDILPGLVDDACDFVAWNPWILNAWKQTILGKRITVADTAGLDPDADL
jgi:hypothetical protein